MVLPLACNNAGDGLVQDMDVENMKTGQGKKAYLFQKIDKMWLELKK